jgi:mono/diheme cytochrome c family protein
LKNLILSLAVVVVLGWTARAEAGDPPSYSQDVKPLMVKYCMDCHGGSRTKAGLDLSSLESIMKGSRKRAVVVAGNADKSALVRTMEGGRPQMPPRKYAKQPTEKEVALVRAWIEAGAKDVAATKETPEKPAPTPKTEEKTPEKPAPAPKTEDKTPEK